MALASYIWSLVRPPLLGVRCLAFSFVVSDMVGRMRLGEDETAGTVSVKGRGPTLRIVTLAVALKALGEVCARSRVKNMCLAVVCAWMYRWHRCT